MTYTKNYGLKGTASSVQYGKDGGTVYYDVTTGNFSVRQSNEVDFVPLIASSLTAFNSDVNIISPTGKLFFSSTSLSLQQTGVLKFDGNAAVSIPVGNNSQRPSEPTVGMLRINTETTPTAEYWNGSEWKAIGSGAGSTNIGATDPIKITVVGDVLTVELDTVPVSKGGTGKTELTSNQVLYGNGTQPVGQSSSFIFNPTETKLTVGETKPILIDGANATISSTGTDSDLVLKPNGTGTIVVTGTNNLVMQTNTGERLTLRAKTSNLNLESQSGDTTMILPANNLNKVTVTGPSPLEYSDGLEDKDLVNKYYVDTLITTINGGTFG
jgi:hypothetical protein